MKNIIQEVDRYYTEKVKKYGNTPQGVDWNSVGSQELRFAKLSEVINTQNNFSILDYGCGYAALFQYINGKFRDFNYTGFDISEEMLKKANENISDKRVSLVNTINTTDNFDFVVASGIFNVKINTNEKDWLKYIYHTINQMNQLSNKGFSYNILTKYSDKEFMKKNLHYADPLIHFDYCKKHFSKNVALLHDYSLYEFTILVRK